MSTEAKTPTQYENMQMMSDVAYHSYSKREIFVFPYFRYVIIILQIIN